MYTKVDGTVYLSEQTHCQLEHTETFRSSFKSSGSLATVQKSKQNTDTQCHCLSIIIFSIINLLLSKLIINDKKTHCGKKTYFVINT